MIHNYKRHNLYDVSTERLLGRKLVIVKSFWPWSKKCRVDEYAVYECVGRRNNVMGWFAFMEEEYTNWSKGFDTVEEAKQFVRKENGRAT